MSESYKVVVKGGTGEIIEKKSRFIASVFRISSEDEAASLIEQTRKKYWDARHNCHAYVMDADGGKQRCSDDGEPSGTAGRPMLEVLLNEDIRNVLVVVTRYFGGTLLGTGGLVRAYTAAVKAGLAGSLVVQRFEAVCVSITADYNGIGKLQYIAAQLDIHIMDTVYEDIVKMILLVPDEKMNQLIDKVNEATQGSAVIDEGDRMAYAVLGDGSVIFV